MEPVFKQNTMNKEKAYQDFLLMYRSYIEGEDDFISLLSNTSAALMEAFQWFWVGFYLVKKDNSKDGETLHIGPFQGTAACNRIRKGRGVCGTAWAESETQVVPDVDLFPGHIACASASRSEIVVPMFNDGKVIGVLDIDSAELNTFDDIDKTYLERIVSIMLDSYSKCV